MLASALVASFPTKQANAAACPAPSETLGSATTTVDIPSEGEYTVWSRIKAPDTTNDSYNLEVNGECYTVGDGGVAANSWEWVEYKDGADANKIRLQLPAGSVNLKFIGKESGVALDKVMFVQDDTCVPSNLGENCASTSDNAGPAINLTSPTANATVTGTVNIAATAGDNPGGSSIAKVEFYVDDEMISSDTEEPYSASWDSTTVANGSVVISAKAYDAAGNTADSSYQVTVQNDGNDTGGGDDDDGGNDPGTDPGDDDGGNDPGNDNGGNDPGDDDGGNDPGNDNGGNDPGDDDGGNDPGDDDGGNDPGDIQNPTTPGNVTAAAAGSNKVNLSWGASNDNVGVTGYKVVRDGIEVASVGSNTSYADNTVQPSTTYSYQVMAVDGAGNASPLSTAVSVTTPAPAAPDTQAPSTPADLKGTAASSKQINLSWRASTDNTGVNGYEVYRVTGNKTGAGEKVATVNTTSFGDSGLNPSTAYTYYVVAKDTAGNRSPESSRVTVTTLAVNAVTGLPSTGPGDDSLGLTGPGGIKGSINLKVTGGRVVVWINGTKRIFSLDSQGNYNVAGLPRGVYSVKYTLRNYRVSFLWLKVDDGVKSQNVSLKQ